MTEFRERMVDHWGEEETPEKSALYKRVDSIRNEYKALGEIRTPSVDEIPDDVDADTSHRYVCKDCGFGSDEFGDLRTHAINRKDKEHAQYNTATASAVVVDLEVEPPQPTEDVSDEGEEEEEGSGKSPDLQTEIETDEEVLSVEQLAATAVEVEDVAEIQEVTDKLIETASSTEERVQAIILSDEELHKQADEGADRELIETVQERVRETFGRVHSPTPDAVRSAIANLRLEEVLDSLGDEIEPQDTPQKIVYICELCGKESTRLQEIRDHISNGDDAVHCDRSARESHLIGVRGEPAEEPRPPEDGEFDDGFDLLWAIYQNPDARQKDIEQVLGISHQTLHDRLDDLGLNWKNREEEVNERIGELLPSPPEIRDDEEEEEETITRTAGNASYTGSATGLDATMQSITERPALAYAQSRSESESESATPAQDALQGAAASSSGTLTVEIPTEDARTLLVDDDPSDVKEHVLDALLQTALHAEPADER